MLSVCHFFQLLFRAVVVVNRAPDLNSVALVEYVVPNQFDGEPTEGWRFIGCEDKRDTSPVCKQLFNI